MFFFGYVKKINGIMDVVNFEIFGNLMFLLFCVGMVVGWNIIFDLFMVLLFDCDLYLENDGFNGNCGNSFFVVFFFVSYIIIIFLIIINMYIVVILENFNEV